MSTTQLIQVIFALMACNALVFVLLSLGVAGIYLMMSQVVYTYARQRMGTLTGKAKDAGVYKQVQQADGTIAHVKVTQEYQAKEAADMKKEYDEWINGFDVPEIVEVGNGSKAQTRRDRPRI